MPQPSVWGKHSKRVTRAANKADTVASSPLSVLDSAAVAVAVTVAVAVDSVVIAAAAAAVVVVVAAAIAVVDKLGVVVGMINAFNRRVICRATSPEHKLVGKINPMRSMAKRPPATGS